MQTHAKISIKTLEDLAVNLFKNRGGDDTLEIMDNKVKKIIEAKNENLKKIDKSIISSIEAND